MRFFTGRRSQGEIVPGPIRSLIPLQWAEQVCTGSQKSVHSHEAQSTAQPTRPSVRTE
jgi:hypothetical protein